MAEKQAVDTIWGRIAIGLAIAAGSAVISWIVARASYVPPPPQQPTAVIAPTTYTAAPGETVEFSASGSSAPSSNAEGGAPLIYHWSVGGVPPEMSAIARCNENTAILRCRFVSPGAFAVSVAVVDQNKQSASAASIVTVGVPGGYLGIFLLGATRADAHRALLYDVDWVEVQSKTSQPIVLYDPDTDAAIFAMQADPPADAVDPPPWRGEAGGLKIALPPMPRLAREALEMALLDLGLSVVQMPSGEIYHAGTRGAVDAVGLPLDTPEGLIAARESMR
jgi:hypothetical protein